MHRFCAAENKEFWACYEKERGGIGWRTSKFLQEMMRVPEGMRRMQEEGAAAEKQAQLPAQGTTKGGS